MIEIAGGSVADSGGVPSGVGVATLPVRVNIGAPGVAALPVRISVVLTDILSGVETATDGGDVAAVWGILVEVGGVDVSTSVIGEVIVEAEESAARVADFSLHQPPGTVFLPASWSGRAVRIYLNDMSSGAPASQMLIFSGVVDLPHVAPRSGQISLRCTDNRQGVISALDNAAVASLLAGSRYSPAIFSAGATALQHANDRLSTIPSALDLSPSGALRVTPWAAKTLADLSFSEYQVLDESVSVDVAERGSLVNKVAVEFGYRLPRIKAEGYLVSYNFLALNHTSFVYWIRDGNLLLQRAAVKAAISAAGGSLVSVTWIPLPTTARIIPGTGGAPAGAWLPNPPVDVLYCLGFSAVVSFDYAQQIDETHQITVYNPVSVATVGVVSSSMSGALEGVYDDPVAVEQNILLYRQEVTTIPPKNLAAVEVGLTNSVNGTLTADSDRSAANAAMETMIAIASTKIHASHRQHSVGAAVPANPVLDVDKTVAIDAQGVTAKGKVRRVVHRLNQLSGSAISEFDLAICSVAGVGITHAEDAIAAPAGTSDGTTNTLAAPVVTWNGLAGQDSVITIEFPGVEDAERARRATVIDSECRAAIPEDLLEVEL